MRCTVQSVTIEPTDTTPRVVIRYEWDEAPKVTTFGGRYAEVFCDHTGDSPWLVVIRYEGNETPGVITLDGRDAEVFLDQVDQAGGSRWLIAEASEVVVG